AIGRSRQQAQVFPGHFINTRIARQLGPLKLQATPIGVQLAHLSRLTLGHYEQLARLIARRDQRDGRKHEKRRKEETEPAHYFFLLEGRDADCGTRRISFTNDSAPAPGSGASVRWATRNTAERARGLAAVSSALATTLPMGTRMGCGISF